MKADTIKTLAEYIAKLNDKNARAENYKEYADDEFDTNGVEQDHIEDSVTLDTRSRANP